MAQTGQIPQKRTLKTTNTAALPLTAGTGGRKERHAYGRYENVILSEKELAELKTELPDKWEYYIDRLSVHIASTGKKYNSHAATIFKWAQEDKEKTDKKSGGIPDYSYKEGESL